MLPTLQSTLHDFSFSLGASDALTGLGLAHTDLVVSTRFILEENKCRKLASIGCFIESFYKFIVLSTSTVAGPIGRINGRNRGGGTR